MNTRFARRPAWVLGCCALAWALLSFMAAVQAASTPRAVLVGALRDGTPLVVVVAATKKADDSNEAYGDWADLLNEFAAHAPPNVKIVRLGPRDFAMDFAKPHVSGSFSTLFIRDAAHALLYDGMIVEANVYVLGRAYLSSPVDLAKAATWGLHETVVALR
jgi:hypothetical protein